MSDEIEITRGGVIDVDTEQLRMLLSRLVSAVGDLRRAEGALLRVWRILAGLPDATDSAYQFGVLRREVGVRAGDLSDTAARTRLLIEAYEIVEMRARLQLAQRGDDLWALVNLRLSVAMLERRSSLGAKLAEELVQARNEERRAAFARQGWGAFGFGALAVLVAQAALRGFHGLVASFGRGIPGVPLKGTAPSVDLHPGPAKTAQPVASLADAFSRLPDKPSQVRVERYEMPDGTSQFVVYVAGSRAIGGIEPWNMESNLAMYAEGELSASYEATRQALLAAGAEPGDVVHALGHSQGAMIAGFLGIEQEFTVRSVFTAGNPIEPQLSDVVLSVQLRHSDDVVSALADGGSPAGTGAPGSIVVSRVGDPAFGPQDLFARSHHMDRYIDTATLLEASADPRLGTIDARWAELGTATKVTTTNFIAILPESP